MDALIRILRRALRRLRREPGVTALAAALLALGILVSAANLSAGFPGDLVSESVRATMSPVANVGQLRAMDPKLPGFGLKPVRTGDCG